MKINFFKTKKSFKKSSSEVNPDTYWKIILVVFLAMLLIAFAFGFYMFKRVAKEQEVSTAGAENTKSPVNKEKISEVLDFFREREDKSREIINSVPPVVDPSL